MSRPPSKAARTRSAAKAAGSDAKAGRPNGHDSLPFTARTVPVTRDPAADRLAAARDEAGLPLQAALRAPHICFERILPDEVDAERQVRRALRTEPMPEDQLTLDPEAVAYRKRMAVVLSRKWDPGTTLRCRFLGGTPWMQAKVERHCRAWEAHAAIRFSFVDDGPAEIRIAFNENEGSWSAVGRDALNTRYFPSHGPTMNFGWITDGSAATSDRAVILHEFGHALGCPHVHPSPSFQRVWNRAAVYAYFKGPPNYWSRAEIDSNVLGNYSATGVKATVCDRRSIMLYTFSADLFDDGQGPTNGNTSLSTKDAAMIAKMYPAPGGPPRT